MPNNGVKKLSKNKVSITQNTSINKVKSAERLLAILTRLNDGERLSCDTLMMDYEVSKRTIQRDMNLLSTLPFAERGTYYRLENKVRGRLEQKDMQRLINFANVQNLLPEFDRQFFQQHLMQSIMVKGVSYENIDDFQAEFDSVSNAIYEHRVITFDYIKMRDKYTNGVSNHYAVEPYRLLNKRGVWYLVGIKVAKNAVQIQEQGAFCFTQISNIQLTDAYFVVDKHITEKIHATDSIYYKDLEAEIVIEVEACVSGYFERRKLLANQAVICRLENGNLLLSCKNVSAQDIFPQVRAWIPHIRIISPSRLQKQMKDDLRRYLE